MTTKTRPLELAREGSRRAEDFHGAPAVETTGNDLSGHIRVTKQTMVNCALAAVDSFLASHRNVSREQLAEDVCGMSPANFSKVINGVQGDFLALIEKLPGDIQDDYFERVDAARSSDPVAQALEVLAV